MVGPDPTAVLPMFPLEFSILKPSVWPPWLAPASSALTASLEGAVSGIWSTCVYSLATVRCRDSQVGEASVNCFLFSDWLSNSSYGGGTQDRAPFLSPVCASLWKADFLALQPLNKAIIPTEPQVSPHPRLKLSWPQPPLLCIGFLIFYWNASILSYLDAVSFSELSAVFLLINKA